MNRKVFALSTLVLLAVLITVVGCQQETQTSPPDKTISLLTQGEYIPDIATFLQIGGNNPAGYSWDGKDVYFTSSMS